MGDIKQRLIQIADYKNISKREFCRKIEVSSAFMANSGDLSSQVLLRILNNFPEINIMWLLSGEGQMTKTEAIEKELKIDDSIKNLIDSNKLLTETNAKLVQLLVQGPAGGDVECVDVQSAG